MTYNNLPPQAYTKEDVARAYVWIQTQPERIRNLATSKETLVALYLQSRRGSNATLKKMAPVSSIDFQKQLKGLASELNQFEEVQKNSKKEEEVSPKNPSSTETPDPSISQKSLSAANKESLKAPPLASQEDGTIEKTLSEFKNRPQTFENPLPSTSNKKTFIFQLDPRSEQILRSVKSHLNMESEQDIIRMLLVLGYDRVKGLFFSNK